MATRTNYFIQKSLDHIYLNSAITNIGDASGLPAAATAGNLYMALLVSGTETAYTSYARQPIPRSGSGFVRDANVVSNVAQVNFPKSTGAGETTCNQVAIYDAVSGGNQMHLQTLAYDITTTINHIPIIEAGALTITGS